MRRDRILEANGFGDDAAKVGAQRWGCRSFRGGLRLAGERGRAEGVAEDPHGVYEAEEDALWPDDEIGLFADNRRGCVAEGGWRKFNNDLRRLFAAI